MRVRVFRWSQVVAGSLLVGCGGEATGPRPAARVLNPIISNPIAVPPAATGVVALPAQRSGPVAYVSLMPGSVPRGRTLEITNLASGIVLTATFVDGGVDPVPIEAAEGDRLKVTATDSGALQFESVTTVRGRVPPRVVRIVPGPHVSDVPLNIRVQVVFSEPVTDASAAAGIRLRQAGVDVAATIGALPGSEVVMELVPAEPLAGSTTFELVADTRVLDIDGDALAEPATSSFTTGSPASPPSSPVPPVPQPPLPAPTALPSVPAGLAPLLLVDDTSNVVYLTTASGSVTAVVRPRFYDPRPAWSPDGQWIVYADTPEDDTLQVALFLVRPDGTGRSRLTTGNGWAAAWSPDGQVIAYECEAAGNTQLCAVNADGTGARVLASGGLQSRSLAWSPDGQRIAFYHYEFPPDGPYYPDLYVMGLDGSSPTRLVQANWGGAGEWLLDGRAPAWSRDADRITFAAMRHRLGEGLGEEAGIFVVRLDGSEPVQLVTGHRADGRYWLGDPDWSSGGELLAVGAMLCDWYDCYEPAVWILSADGSRVVARVSGAHSPAWRP